MSTAAHIRWPEQTSAPEWLISPGLTDYVQALAMMEDRVRAIRDGTQPELIWLLQHPPLYTAGTSAKREDLIDPDLFPVHQTGRGGQFTYHGPGQRVVYVMLDVRWRCGGDVRAFITALEAWISSSLRRLGIESYTRPGDVGIWVSDHDGIDAKIAALGLRVRNGISFHGLSINVAPDLTHFDGIVPCGLKGSRVTSLKALKTGAGMAELDLALQLEVSNISKR